MAIEIKTTNNKELWEKKRDYLAALRRSTRQPSASIEELRTLAHLSDAGFWYRCSGDPVLPCSG